MGRYSHSKGQRMFTPVVYLRVVLTLLCVQVIALSVQGLLVAVSSLFLEDSPRHNGVRLRMQPDKRKNTRNTNNAFEILVYIFIPHR
jgi:hypothetical protein